MKNILWMLFDHSDLTAPLSCSNKWDYHGMSVQRLPADVTAGVTSVLTVGAMMRTLRTIIMIIIIVTWLVWLVRLVCTGVLVTIFMNIGPCRCFIFSKKNYEVKCQNSTQAGLQIRTLWCHKEQHHLSLVGFFNSSSCVSTSLSLLTFQRHYRTEKAGSQDLVV